MRCSSKNYEFERQLLKSFSLKSIALEKQALKKSTGSVVLPFSEIPPGVRFSVSGKPHSYVEFKIPTKGDVSIVVQLFPNISSNKEMFLRSNELILKIWSYEPLNPNSKAIEFVNSKAKAFITSFESRLQEFNANAEQFNSNELWEAIVATCAKERQNRKDDADTLNQLTPF